MKLISALTKPVVLMLLFISFTACSNDDDDATPPVVETNTIADFVASNEDYSSLEAALERTGLTATFTGTTNYTVFAPDNAAFAAFLEANNFSGLEDVPVDVLTQVLMNHVQEGEIPAADLSTGYIQSMAEAGPSGENLSMYINTEDGVMINGVAEVTTPNIEVDNGIIHAVDSVIGLPNIVTFATADPTFNTLVAALTREDNFTFVETLMSNSEAAPFTVFAPTNAAFEALLAELNANSLADIPAETLADVLSYHVVTNANVTSSELTDAMEVSTLLGQNFTVNIGDNVTITDASGRTATVVATDVQANNGIIHVVDTVLLPQM